MDCMEARDWMFRLMDKELAGSEKAALERHLSGCPSCAREYRILTLPGRIVRALPPIEVSPFFYSALKARLRGEAQVVSIWQLLAGISHRMLPALALLTLAMLCVFTYEQLRSP